MMKIGAKRKKESKKRWHEKKIHPAHRQVENRQKSDRQDGPPHRGTVPCGGATQQGDVGQNTRPCAQGLLQGLRSEDGAGEDPQQLQGHHQGGAQVEEASLKGGAHGVAAAGDLCKGDATSP